MGIQRLLGPVSRYPLQSGYQALQMRNEEDMEPLQGGWGSRIQLPKRFNQQGLQRGVSRMPIYPVRPQQATYNGISVYNEPFNPYGSMFSPEPTSAAYWAAPMPQTKFKPKQPVSLLKRLVGNR